MQLPQCPHTEYLVMPAQGIPSREGRDWIGRCSGGQLLLLLLFCLFCRSSWVRPADSAQTWVLDQLEFEAKCVRSTYETEFQVAFQAVGCRVPACRRHRLGAMGELCCFRIDRPYPLPRTAYQGGNGCNFLHIRQWRCPPPPRIE